MRNPSLTPTVLVAAAFMAFGAAAVYAQVPPFFGGGNSFDPEISVVNSGVVLDAQAVVSADRKYVTLNMRAQNAALIALRDFSFQNGQNQALNFGFVGFPRPVAVVEAPTGRAPSSPAPATRPANVIKPVAPTVLQRTGMTRVDRPRN